MDRFEDIEERVMNLERTKPSKFISINKEPSTTFEISASSYYIDIEVDVISRDDAKIELTVDGKKSTFYDNFAYMRVRTSKKTILTVSVISEAIISKKIRIEGVGVKLLRA